MPTVTVNKNADAHHGPFWVAVKSERPHIARRHLARFCGKAADQASFPKQSGQ